MDISSHSSPSLGPRHRCRHLSKAAAGSELHRLCRNGDLSAIRSYLNETLTERVVNKASGTNGCTPLHEAAMAGRGDVIQLLTEESDSLNLNVRTLRGPASTPLHLAAERGHIECVMALIECGALLEVCDRRCRTAKEVAAENGQKQVVTTIVIAEVEKAVMEGNVVKLNETLAQLQKCTALSDTVKHWRQTKLNTSLQKACRIGNYKLAVPLIKAGARNFEQCIKNSTRTNHILAFLRLCQAALEDDRSTIQLMLEWDEDELNSDHPNFSTLNQYRQILMPLLDNGRLSVTTPIQVAMDVNNVLAAGDILLRATKHPSMGMVDWHGLELTSLRSEWLRAVNYPNLSLLCLSFNHLKTLPKEIAQFTTLVKLQVASNEITIVHPEIFQLPNIESIDLSYNQISALPEDLLKPISPKLRSLNLAYNQLTLFPDYFSDTGLIQLDLSHNRLCELPACICSLRQLESLNLSHNRAIKKIPYEIGGLKMLKILSLDGLPYVYNIPVSKPNAHVMEFFRARFHSMQTVSHFEVVVVGYPFFSSVKSAIVKALRESEGLRCSVLSYNNPTQFLHIHHIFEIPNSLYILPWDCYKSQEANDLHRLLRYLSIFSPEAPVIVAACWRSYMESHSELKVEEKIANSQWQDLSDIVLLKHVLLESTDNGMEDPGTYSLETFMTFVSQVADRVKTTTFVPGSYYSCKETLATVCKQFAIEEKCPLISEWDFWELTRSMPTHDLSNHQELPDLVSFLTGQGAILQIQCPKQSRDSQDFYVLNRQWFLDVLGNVITNRNSVLQESFSAIVRQGGLVDLFADSAIQNPLPNALQYMVNHEGIALLLSSEKWLVPALLRHHPEENIRDLQDRGGGIRRQYTFCMTPACFWGRLITHLQINLDAMMGKLSRAKSGGESPGMARMQSGAVDWTYWNRGIACWKDAHHLVYTIEEIEVRDEPFRESIEIRVPNTPFGHRTMSELMFIVDSLLKNWYPRVWQSLDIWVPCSYCIHTNVLDIPSISFQDCLLAVSKGVGVRCIQHPEKIVSIAKISPDLIQEDVSVDLFLPPGLVAFNPHDKSSCLSQPPSETVFKGVYNSQVVAVKPYPHPIPNATCCSCSKKKMNVVPLLQVWHEFEVLRHLQNSKCPFIVDMKGICLDPLCLVFSFARWSSLEDVIRLRDMTIQPQVRMRMIYQLACALEVVHSLHVIHRNISLANILVYSLSVDDSVNIKLAGFSDACYSIFQGIGVGSCGTFPAPEMLQGDAGEYDERVDIFAFGFVAYEIVTRSKVKVLSNAPLKQQMLSSVDRPSLAPVRSRSPLLTPIINRCWHPDAFKRPYASNIVTKLRDPLHLLAQDGHLVHEEHEFFAASARFCKENSSFKADIFVSSGELTGSSNAFLTHVSLPGFKFNSFSPLPKEYVICMGCIGQQLWVSFYGKKLRVYSIHDLGSFVNEFSFEHHVVVMGLSPISVYLGFENGGIYMYDLINDSIPHEPTCTRMVCKEELKSIEPLEDCIVCATGNKIYQLHPDTLETEGMWSISQPVGRIRVIAVSQFSGDEDSDTVWVCYKRLDQVHVFHAWSGRPCYIIECATLVGSTAEKVYVLSLRVVLDTVWVGLNTGHVLVFEANVEQPYIITHFKVHKSEVREILLLHPSYLGPSTIDSRGVSPSLVDRGRSHTLSAGYDIPDSVYVLTFGTGLHETMPTVNSDGKLEKTTEKDEEIKKNGLYGVVLEGMLSSRMKAVESQSNRAKIPYMEGYAEESYGGGGLEAIYDVPPDVDYEYTNVNNVFRTSTWSAQNIDSPVRCAYPHSRQGSQKYSQSIQSSQSAQYAQVTSDQFEEDYVSMSIGTLSMRSESNASSVPPTLPPRPPDLSTDEPTSGHYSAPHHPPTSPPSASLEGYYDAPKPSAGVQTLPPSHRTGAYDVPRSSVRKSFTKLFRRKKAASVGEKKPAVDSGYRVTERNGQDSDNYDYPFVIPRCGTSLSPTKLAQPADPRRATLATNRPSIEDSAEHKGYDPYVHMGSVFNPDMSVTVTKAKARVQAKKEQIQQAKRQLAACEEDDDFTTIEEFLSPTLSPPHTSPDLPKPHVPPKPPQFTPPRPPKTKPKPSPPQQRVKPAVPDIKSEEISSVPAVPANGHTHSAAGHAKYNTTPSPHSPKAVRSKEQLETRQHTQSVKYLDIHFHEPTVPVSATSENEVGYASIRRDQR